MEGATTIAINLILFYLLASRHTVTAARSVAFEKLDGSGFRNMSFNAGAFLATHYGLRLMECSARCAQESACQLFFVNEEGKTCTIVSAATRPLFMSDRIYVNTRVDNAQCPQETHVVNVRHYYTTTYEDNRDDGIVQTVTFNKTRSDTALRVLWFATTRVLSNAARFCGWYYIKFNGYQCSTPTNIDFSNLGGLHTDQRQLSELDGICYGLPAGAVVVSIVVASCPEFSAVTDSLTGWKASRSMWVYELNTAAITAKSDCAALPFLNTQYYSVSGLLNGLDPDNQIVAITYQKVSSDTVLRVKWQGTARVVVSSERYWCGRWYITVNGTECNPKAEFTLILSQGTYQNAIDNHKTRTLEGFCYGLAAGIYTVALRIGSCHYPSDPPDACTGCNPYSGSRITVSEVRLATTAQFATTTDGRVTKIPFFNLQHWSWYLLDSDTYAGNVVSVTYNKISDSSGLHLRAVGGTRPLDNLCCCRWYFTMNGVECTNPGVIEGVSYTEYETNYHSPGVVDGVCYGLRSASYSIDYNVGQCSGFTSMNCCMTGYGSTLHVIVEEVQPESHVTCATPFSCP